jgi:peroxiredoxin
MKSDRSQIVLVIVCIILLTINVFLIVQNSQLKGSLERSRQVVTEEGYRFSELSFRGMDGNEEKINLANGESKTLLLVFNSSCQYCKQQYPLWKELALKLDAGNWKVLAISSEEDLEKLKAIIKDENFENIKVGSVGTDEMRRARMLFTPMTIAVDGTGEVKKVWTGLWTKGFDLPS